MTPSPSPLVRLYRACEPSQSLEADDRRYVNCDEARGENLVQFLDRRLRRADPSRPEIRLFCGHRGVGKTSELLRLRQLLEHPPGAAHLPFKVVYYDVELSLDVNDLDFPDLLVLTAAELERQLRQAAIPGFSARSELLSRVREGLKRLLGSEVALKEAEIETFFGSLTVELRNRPTARQLLRAAIEQQSTNLLGAVNDLLTTANVSLRNANYEGLVLIIDGLDKVVLHALAGGESNTHKRLFIDRGEQLAGLNSHTIYTVPISLIYSKYFTQLEETLGMHNVPMPMIRLRGADKSDPTPATLGMKKMLEILEARCRYAQVEIKDVFDHAHTAHYLCLMTGGHPRHLMMFLQAALAEIDLFPITRLAAQEAVRKYANSLLRQVPDEFWPKLRQFAVPRDDIPKDEMHREMLFLLHIFEYENGQPWYEVNPVLRTLAKFNGKA
jgi:hypothetical protein